jgi:dTDP-4-dehydrorhamnose reductase
LALGLNVYGRRLSGLNGAAVIPERPMKDTDLHIQGQAQAADLPGRILVLGQEQGMLGPALVHCLRTSGCEVLQEQGEHPGRSVEAWCRELDRLEPDLVINTLGCTDTQKAELEPSTALFWNKELPCALARAVHKLGAGLVSFSSDCVFDGRRQTPYRAEDTPNPVSACGQSFAAGERALLHCGLDNLLIVRSSWLFGPFGPNFVDWVLDQGQQCSCLQVPHDQVGSPTYSLDLALYVLRLIGNGVTGVQHVCNNGQASWCELAAEVLNTCGLNCTIQAVTSGPQLSQHARPIFSVLDPKPSLALGRIKARPWPQALRDYIFTFHSRHIQF